MTKNSQSVYFFPCLECKGLGKVVVTHSGTHNISFSVKLRPCPRCNGTGKIKLSNGVEDEV